MKKKLLKFRPARTDVGGGKFSEALGAGTAIWGVLRYQENTTSVLVDSKEDVLVGDVLEVAEA